MWRQAGRFPLTRPKSLLCCVIYGHERTREAIPGAGSLVPTAEEERLPETEPQMGSVA